MNTDSNAYYLIFKDRAMSMSPCIKIHKILVRLALNLGHGTCGWDLNSIQLVKVKQKQQNISTQVRYTIHK